ncbi:MAG: M23 family metallopeptidase, partial [Microgenomates group bacterium]
LLQLVKAHEDNRLSLEAASQIRSTFLQGKSQEEVAALLAYLEGGETTNLGYGKENASSQVVSEDGSGGDFADLDDYSLRQIGGAEETMYVRSNASGGFAQRFRNWRNGGNPRTKLQSGFNHATNKLFSKGMQAVSPWAAGALAISNNLFGEENTNKVLAGGTAAIISSILEAMSSWGGRIGALLGSAVGGFAGSFLSPAGAVVGALGFGIGGGLAGHTYLQPILDKVFGTGAVESSAGLSGSNLGSLNLGSPSVASRLPLGTNAGTGAAGSGTSGSSLGVNAGTAPLASQAVNTVPGAGASQTGVLGANGVGASAGIGVPQPTFWQTVTESLNQFSVGVAAPIGAMVFGMTSFAFTMWVIFAAFLAPLPLEPGSGSQIPGFLEGFEGCWPTTGTITGYLTYSDTGDPHATMTGSLSGFSGPGTAIDISTGSNQPPIYSPFNGTADFYPNGHGIHPNYGTHVVLTTPDFAIIFAHMRDFGAAATMNEPTLGVPIVAGQQIGNVNSTGNSTGNHLHYEVVGTSILNLLPLSLEFKQAVALDEETIFGLPVSSTDCAIKNLGDPTGFMAIGPKEVSNLLMSSTAEINQGPIRTCSWRQNRNLAVAINANFFNDDGLPSGIAGNNFAKYWGNADNRDITFIEQMQSLVVTSSTDTITMVRPDPDLAYSPEGDFPIDLPQYNSGITGLYVDGDSSTSTLDSRTLVATGTASAECSTEYAGQEVIFFLVMNGVSFDTIEQEARRCGATQFIHLDGGGSSAFCSNDANLNFATTRNVPVSVGMYRAELFSIFDDENGGTVLEGDSGGSVGDPTPPVAPF